MKRVLLVGLLLLGGCSEGPSSGKVIDRTHHESWSESSSRCVQRNSNGTCKRWDYDVVQHPESCELELADGYNQGWITIPCDTFDNYGIGDYYPKGQ